MASTGMRVGAISGLRILDIKNIDEFGLYLIWVYSSSKKDRYYTFCTPECAKAIDDYLAYRKRLGEELKDSSWLIRNKITIDNPFTAKAPKPLGELVNHFKLCKEAGLFIDKRQVMRTHGFRKFFINQLDKAGVHYTTREYLAGHLPMSF